MQNTRTGFALWLERLTAVAVVLVVAASMCRAFWPPFTPPWLRSFPQLQQLADVLCQESDPIKRVEVFLSGMEQLSEFTKGEIRRLVKEEVEGSN